MSSSSTFPWTSRSRRDYVSVLDVDYVDEGHMRAFAEALKADEFSAIADDLTSPSSPLVGPSTPFRHHVRKVSALSDFAPVNTRVRRRKKINSDRSADSRRQEWLFVLVRWPLLTIIFFIIAAEFGFYILIRQLVNTKEWLIAWRGRKGMLRKRLRGAKTYQEWKDAALALDEYLHFDEWKTVDEDSYYDWKLVRKVLRTLKSLRAKNDAHGLLGVLETCIRTNFAGLESPRLYSETFYGTKDLIEAYVTEQERALEFIRNSPDISNEEKKRFFKNANTNLGTTALCLSGGATFGYYHFGVVKAFLDADLLPRVISGTSAGGLVAALVCTRTDEELKQLLVPELANRITACEDPFKIWFQRFWKTGARFDSVEWAKKATFFTRGSMTFQEAYMRTGRILNVSVIPADRHSPTKLLNYLNAPDTVIWSALLASAAVPGILNPVVLMQKLRDGSLVPWNWGSKFKDGSLRVDIPVQSLNLYFNVTHPVVSQVNPHVHLFFFAPRGSAGKPVASRKQKGWRGNFLLSAAEQWLKLELTKNFKVIRDLDLLPTILGQDWSSVFLQRFDGTVTIWPRTRFKDWINILSDPDVPELDRMIRVGQLVTWPKLHIIENRYRVEKQIFLGRRAVRRAMRTRVQERLDKVTESQPQGKLPTPITDTKLTVPQLALSQSTDSPVPIDTDTEDDYKANRGGRSPRHRSHRNSYTSQSPHLPRSRNDSTQDVRRAFAARRVWPALQPANGDSGDDIPPVDYGRASPDPPPERDGEVGEQPEQQQSSARTASPAAFFQRLRTASFSPFTSIRQRGSRVFGNDPMPNGHERAQTFGQSSESSSDDDDDLSILSRRVWAATADRSDSLSQDEDIDDGEGQDENY
ncbi:acyl transferase/acyl hydrolase/lysophospholipase [Irpex rosettiformis]|uniref:Acyl transferase/acyl hydrolase/lysophospholipase n=1 Tax=Irpex rosettiformis TaxID=378272 RepID=A0ACB8UDS4_9APHY|nr:acyl transferase/acyl hydrolase/lysophospholipase [Irpex rosettiformis]